MLNPAVFMSCFTPAIHFASVPYFSANTLSCCGELPFLTLLSEMPMNAFFRYTVALFLAVGFLGGVALAGNTGKIVGKATDSKTGEVLPGVNVQVIGTTRGANATASPSIALLSATNSKKVHFT